jgi:predicted acyl esterase
MNWSNVSRRRSTKALRQIQNLGAPAGFIEAGATDFFVPRGYVHLIANCRGTGGSGGTFGFFDGQEHRDMHDLVEWAAEQPWSNANVGMISRLFLPVLREGIDSAHGMASSAAGSITMNAPLGS